MITVSTELNEMDQTETETETETDTERQREARAAARQSSHALDCSGMSEFCTSVRKVTLCTASRRRPGSKMGGAGMCCSFGMRVCGATAVP